MALASSTRGVSFDPTQAAREREHRQAVEMRKRAEVERIRLRAQSHSEQSMSPKKALAIQLDQIERCYREHMPPQQRRA